MMVSAAFKRFPLVSIKLVCVRPLSTGLPLCGSTGMLLFKIPDRLICVTLSLKGSTSILLSSRSVSDLDGCEAILWLGSCGVDRIMGCWLLLVDMSSYRKSVLLSGMGRGPVGVDVLCVGGGVFFLFW